MSEQQDINAFTGDTDVTAPEDESGTAADGSRFWPDLPAEWRLAAAGDVYSVNPRYTPDGDEITYIEMDALDTELPYPKYFGRRVAEDYSGKLFTPGDTLFARITPCTENRKAAFVLEMESDVGIGSTEFAVLSPDTDQIHPWLLYYLANSHPIHEYAVSRMRGSTGRQRVPFDMFRREIDLPIPPAEEQRKIAAVLNNIDQIIRDTQELVGELDVLKRGVVEDLFTSGTRDYTEFTEEKFGKYPAEWDLVRFEDLLADTRYGTDTKSNTDGDGYPTLRIPNVVGKRLTLDDLKHTPVSDDELDRLRLEEDDILVVRTNGNPDYVGQCVTFPGMDEDYVYASYLIRIRVDTDRVLPAYVREFLNSARGRSEMSGWIRSSAGNYNLSVGAMEKFHIPVPPLKEQAEIVENIESVEQEAEENRRYIDEMKRLKRGLMQDLLTGAIRTDGEEIDIPDEVKNYEPE